MKYQVKRVKGAQADMAKRLGLVKIAKSSAKDLFELGVPLVLVGNNVNDYHFFGGWHLAMHMDSQRIQEEGWGFDRYVNNWAFYNKQDQGAPAFFVDQKYVGGKGGVGGGKRRQAMSRKIVYLRLEDQDRHEPGCDCGSCNANGKSYGVSIYEKDYDDPIDVIYAPSEPAALAEARAVCKKNGWKVFSSGGGKRRHANQWKLVRARGGDVLGKEKAPSARLALRKHHAKGHGTTGVVAVRAGGKRRHAPKQPSVGKLTRELDSMLKG